MILQAMPLIHPLHYEGGPLFAETAPLSFDYSMWGKGKKVSEVGGTFSCKVIASNYNIDFDKVRESHLVINPSNWTFTLKTPNNAKESAVYSLQDPELTFTVGNRKSKPNEIHVLHTGELKLRIGLTDYTERDLVLLALRTISHSSRIQSGTKEASGTDSSTTPKGEDTFQSSDKHERIKLITMMDQLIRDKQRLHDDNEALKIKVQMLNEKLDMYSMNEINLKKTTTELDDQNRKAIAEIEALRTTSEKLIQENSFYLNVSAHSAIHDLRSGNHLGGKRK